MMRFLIPFGILVAILKSSWLKGVVGEIIVNLLAKWSLDKKKYHLLKNVTLPTIDGTTQIDHIIVSIYGVFVVETKNMRVGFLATPNRRYGPKKYTGIPKSFKTRCTKTIST